VLESGKQAGLRIGRVLGGEGVLVVGQREVVEQVADGAKGGEVVGEGAGGGRITF